MSRTQKHTSSFFSWFYLFFIFALLIQQARAIKEEERLSRLMGDIIAQQFGSYDSPSLDLSGLTEMLLKTSVSFNKKNQEIKLFAEKGGDLNQKINGRSILYRLLDQDHFNEITLLVQHGFDINAEIEDTATPIFYAVFENLLELSALLITLGADVTESRNLLMTMAFNHNNPELAALIAQNTEFTLLDDLAWAKLYPEIYPKFKAILEPAELQSLRLTL